MTKEIEVIEGNKLIAEFMGYEKRENVFDSRPLEYLMSDYWTVPKNMQYHTSWDWLMPTWSKLYKLFIAIDRAKEERKRNDAMNFVDRFSLMVNQNNIAAAFEIMVEALQWYNSRQPDKSKINK